MLKRAFDLLLGAILGAGFLLVLPIVLLLVWGSLGLPLFFRQRRVGLADREFEVLKIRTMTDDRDADGRLLPDSERVTPVGAMLRRFRLDELPCVVNILRGELSLVGPRPLPRQPGRDTAAWRLRHSVRPGFTGLAQISGNTLLREEEKLALDVYYVETRSFLTDMVILAKTLQTVVLGEKRNEVLIERAIQQLDRPERMSR